MRLFVVRHGETDYNRSRMMQGYREIPLNDAGIAQATRLAVRLRDERIDRIVCSDLRRAAMTGCIIAAYTGAPMTYDAELRERDPGALVGRSYDDEPRFFTDQDFVPPEGEGTSEFRARVRAVFERIVVGTSRENERVAVVTHGMVCQAFVGEFFGDSQSAAVVARNSSISVAECTGGRWSPIRLDCVAHLDGAIGAAAALAEGGTAL